MVLIDKSYYTLTEYDGRICVKLFAAILK